VFNKTNPLFKDLPGEISKILLHKFADLLSDDFNMITQLDNFSVPTAIKLYDHDMDNDRDIDTALAPNIALFPETPESITDEILPEESGDTVDNPELRVNFADNDFSQDIQDLLQNQGRKQKGRGKDSQDRIEQRQESDSDSENQESPPTTRRLRFGRGSQ
jgi:hypothetical protein